MLKNILKLNGVKTLKKDEQQSISAGTHPIGQCQTDSDCPPGTECIGCFCLDPGGPY